MLGLDVLDDEASQEVPGSQKFSFFPGQRGGVVLIQSKLCEEVSLRIAESRFSLCKPWRLMKALPSTEIMLFSLQHSTTDPKTPQRSPGRALSEHPWTDPNTLCWMGSLWEQWGDFWLSRCYGSGRWGFYIPHNKLKLPQELQRQRDDREVKVTERREKQRNALPKGFPPYTKPNTSCIWWPTLPYIQCKLMAVSTKSCELSVNQTNQQAKKTKVDRRSLKV